jgi:hypothetical protein
MATRIEITEDGLFRSSEWTPIGDIAGQTIYGRHVAYDELGRPRCDFAALSDFPTAYTLGFDGLNRPSYTAEGEPGRPSYQPACVTDEDVRNLPPKLDIRQGWHIYPRYLADGRPDVFKLGGSERSPSRPPCPDFSGPAAVAALDEMVAAFKESLPECPARIDLYRACEGDNPALMRVE